MIDHVAHHPTHCANISNLLMFILKCILFENILK
jgi:hypothetical protein